MFRSITFKLWLTIALALVFSLGALLGLTHYSLHKRFVTFSLRAIEEHLPPLSDKIVEVYTPGGSLEPFERNKKLWYLVVYRSLPFTQTDEGPAPPPKHWKKHQELKNAQKRFVRSLALYDAERKLVAGREELHTKRLWHPVEYKGKVIAYVVYEKPHYVLKRSEAIFLQQQFKFFLLLSGAMVIAALFLAAFISRWLIAPVRRLSEGARKVSDGDFSARVHYQSRDELGQLCQNFNSMTARLEANQKAQRQWIADISHEMRTPVAVLKGQIEAIQDGIRPATPENIRVLSDKVESLRHLIDDLFELALSDVGELHLHLQRIDLVGLLTRYVELNRSRVAEFGHTLELQCPKTPLWVNADERRLTQVLNNVLENSLRYTDSPGQLRWRLSKQRDIAIVTVEDSAPGVPTEAQAHIFDRLFRVEKSRNRSTGGAGLGLALCQNFIEAHGGQMRAANSELGGLSILIELPLSEGN